MLLGALHLAVIALILHGLSWLAVHPAVYALVYARQMHPANGYRLASALSAFRSAAPPRALIIGPSTAVQMFDDTAISSVAPAYTVINASTSGGTLYCQETLLRAIKRQDARPDIMVVTLSAMEMIDHPLDLVDNGYTDLFDLRDADLAESEEEGRDRVRMQLLIHTLFPPSRHRRSVAMHWRLALYNLQAAYRSKPLESRRFQRSDYEFALPVPFPPNQVRPDQAKQDKMRGLWQKGRRLNPGFVGLPRHFAQLDRILAAACEQAPFVVVLMLPHHSWVREHVDSLVQQRLYDHLQTRSGSRCIILDWSALLDDEDFFDDVHPTVKGRAKASAALGDFLNTLPKP